MPPTVDAKQTVTDQLPQRHWDCIVVGAGPAGSAAALTLARAGRSVLLLDRQRFPRDKACGDALTRKALIQLDDLGLAEPVEARAHSVPTARIVNHRGDMLSVAIRCLTLKRRHFDGQLADAASEAGACFALGEAAALHQDGDRVTLELRGDAPALTARYLVVANGAAGRDLHANGERVAPSAFALRGYAAGQGDCNELVLCFNREVRPGYSWIFPMGEGHYNLGVGTGIAGGPVNDLAGNLERFVDRHPLVRALRLDDGPLAGRKGAPLRFAMTDARLPSLQGRVLAAGEAIAATYPFTGEGISTALWTGRLAGEAVVRALGRGSSEALRIYPERLAGDIAPNYRRYRLVERLFFDLGCGDGLLAFLARTPTLRRLARRVSRETRAAK